MLKRPFFVYIIFLFFTGTAFAQKTEPVRSDSLSEYQQKYFNDPTDPIVLTAADTLLQMAIRAKDTVMIKQALGAKLDYYYYGQGKNHTDSVVAWVHRIQRHARNTKDSELYYWAWAARLINYYIKQGEYNIALVEAEKMLSEAQKEGIKSTIAECYYALANIYSSKGMMRKSQEFMLKEIDLFEKNNMVRLNISFQYSDAAKIYVDYGEIEKASELLKKALKYANTNYHKVTAKLVYVSLYLAQGNVSAARQELEECRQMYVDDPALRRHIHYFYSTEIDFYQQTGDYNKALAVVEQREERLKKANDLTTLGGLYKTKADILWNLGRKEEAAGLYRESLQEDRKEKERNEEITTGEFATLLNLQQLNTEKRELEKASQEKQLQNTRIILFLLFGLLCIVVIFLYYQRKLNRKLKRSRDKLDEKNRILIEAEEELRKAKEIAEQSSWMKTVFIQNMSHEIRTPLNSIVGFSAVLADMFEDQEDIKQYATLIEDNSKLLLKLISDILDISALDNDVDIKRTPTDVNGCCYNAIDKVRYMFGDNVKLQFEPTLNELMINSNGERISQVLENLLNNASKFTHKGTVTLKYELIEQKKQLIFTVTDTGIGIPVDEQEHVFGRFVKLDDFSQGTGLGLSICRIIAEKLGGYLIIDKEYTQGTRFIFSVAI